MKMFWCDSCAPNFGDVLGPALFRRWGHRVEWAPVEQADIVTVGSILSKVPEGWRGAILGTGMIKWGLTKDLSEAHVLSVRGAYTRDACNLSLRTPLGDLGVLAGDLLPDWPPLEKVPLGIVPHHVDRAMRERYPHAQFIDIEAPPEEVVFAVASCERIVTSSLHGLVLADALGIPHTLELHPAVIGGIFKFRDYASALGEEITPGLERLSDRGRMANVKATLRALARTITTS